MSSQRGIGRDLDGKVQKRKNNSHQEEEPEARTEPVSITGTGGQPNRKLENLSDLIDNKISKKPRSLCTSYQSAEAYEYRMAAKNLMVMARTNCDMSAVQFALDRYLDEGIVAKESGKFIITMSSEMATRHFLIADTQEKAEHPLLFSDKNDNEWSMKLSVPELAIRGRRQSFFHSKEVKVNDIVKFYRPLERFHRMHFLVECFPYLFEKNLTAAEVTKPQLHICRPHIEHFYHDKTGEAMAVLNRSIRVFDYENNSWEMKLVYYDKKALKITGCNWKEFAAKHNLIVNDTIRFYKASTNGSSYLIRFERVNT